MNGGEDVLADEAFIQQNGVFVVVAFPRHEADKHVLAERDLTLRAGGAVGDDLTGFHTLADRDDRALVDTGALVGTSKLCKGIIGGIAIVVADGNVRCGNAGHDAGAFSCDADLGIDSALMLDAGCHDRGLRDHQRHGLTLHVCAHQRTVRVVVLEERDERRCDGGHHVRGYIDIVDQFTFDRDDLVTVAADDARVRKAAFLVQRLCSLCDIIVVFDVGGHVFDNIRDLAGCLIDLAERRFDEAVFVDLGIGRQIVDQADVRAFRRLDRAHAAIVRVVNVSDVEGCTLTRQTAGAECGQTALVRQFCQRVVLIHKLRQRRGAEELFDDCRDRSDVDEALRRDDAEILHGHALTDDAFEAGEADAELILQQFAHAAQTAVAQMVNVVLRACALHHAAQVVDGGKNVVFRDVHRNEVAAASLDSLFPAVGGDSLEHFTQHAEADLFLDAILRRVEIDELRHIDHAVGEDDDLAAVHVDHGAADAAAGDLVRLGAVDRLAVHSDDLTGHGIGHRLGQRLAVQTAPDVKFFVEFIAADLAHVIAAGIEEQRLEITLGTFDCGRLSRTQAAVNFKQRFLARLARVLVHGRLDERILTEHLGDLAVGRHAEGADEAGDGQLAVFVDADPKDVIEIRLIFQPCAAVRNDRCGIDMLVSLVYLVAKVNAGASDDLGDNDTLCAVDDEGAAVGHEREIAHENLLLLDLVGLFVVQTHANLDGLCVRCVALLALLHGVLGRLVHGVVEETQFEIAGIVGNGIDIAEHLAQALAQKPLIGILLDLEHVRQFQDLLLLGKTLAERLAHHDILCDRHVTSSQPFCSCLMTRAVALFISFHSCLHIGTCSAIIMIDSGEKCE